MMCKTSLNSFCEYFLLEVGTIFFQKDFINIIVIYVFMPLYMKTSGTSLLLGVPRRRRYRINLCLPQYTREFINYKIPLFKLFRSFLLKISLLPINLNL